MQNSKYTAKQTITADNFFLFTNIFFPSLFVIFFGIQNTNITKIYGEAAEQWQMWFRFLSAMVVYRLNLQKGREREREKKSLLCRRVNIFKFMTAPKNQVIISKMVYVVCVNRMSILDTLVVRHSLLNTVQFIMHVVFWAEAASPTSNVSCNSPHLICTVSFQLILSLVEKHRTRFVILLDWVGEFQFFSRKSFFVSCNLSRFPLQTERRIHTHS